MNPDLESHLNEIEAKANENISRGYMAESVEIPSYDWAMLNDKILKLLKLCRIQKFALEELNEQSIAHSDNSLSSKWIEHKTNEALSARWDQL